MKYKLLATLLAAAMLVSPVLGFWHPPPPPDGQIPQHPVFAVLINGQYSWIFNETTDNFCDTFTVTVGLLNVTDLFGYEFKLWWNDVYFDLVSYTVEQTWPSQFQVKPDLTYDNSRPYVQVVAAMDPSVGVSGDILLATLVFHIRNDVCYLQGTIGGLFEVYETKASNSCSGTIELCNPFNAHWSFVPKKPEICIDPAEINCSKVGTTFEVTVSLKDIVKMTDFNIQISWNAYHYVDLCIGDIWNTLLYTKKENVVINEDVFPKAWRAVDLVDVFSPKCGRNDTYPYGYVHVNVAMNSSFPLINGTMWLFKVTFTQCDPWYCGAQPLYTIDLEDHTVTMENACTDIYFVDGYISVKCPDPANMYLGNNVDYCNAHYCFLPIPGDLDGSGHTGVEDLMIEAARYGNLGDCAVPVGESANARNYYYDLNRDGVIDIYDLVIVAKNFCRDKP